MPEVAAGSAGRQRPFRVGELLGGLRELLEEDVGRVWVVGEISNLRRVGSGHTYFTLKDDDAQVRAALFRGTAARLPFDPEEGLTFVVQADVTIYTPRGDLQLVVRHLEPLGRGALQLAFEQLRARLEAEGLFDEAAKRELPPFPRRVGVVTSPTGAAVRDVIRVSGARFASIPLLIAPSRVQGEGAEREVVAALRALEAVDDVDVILLVRGGGSLEDLQAFNTELVARSVRSCRVPVVVGVGHEVDVTIADLAADVRAPTPSAAAMVALPDGGAWRDRLGAAERSLASALAGHLARARAALRSGQRALRVAAPAARLAARRARLEAARGRLLREAAAGLVARASRAGTASARLGRTGRALAARGAARRQRLDERLTGAGRERLRAGRVRLAQAAGRLDALSPLGVLGRGYAIACDAEGRVLRRAREVAAGDTLRVRLHEGELDARVEAVHDAPPASPGPVSGTGTRGPAADDPDGGC